MQAVIQGNSETLQEFNVRKHSAFAKAERESFFYALRWIGIVVLLIGVTALLCLASIVIDRNFRDPIVQIEKKGFDCQPKGINEQLRDKLRRR